MRELIEDAIDTHLEQKIITQDAPLYMALRKYENENIIPFHMPGHKMGKGIIEEFQKDFFKLDVTEVEGTDNLHYPTGAIKEAEDKAAKAFGTNHTYFLVNGSSCGIYSMILAACNPKEKIIVARNCHKSVLGGIVLGDLVPVFVVPEVYESFGIAAGFDLGKLEKTMQENSDAKAVLITCPDYYGLCADIKSISKLCKKYNMLLLIDEAHGAHFSFSDQCPPSAISLGADIAVQSAHKTLPALTQGSYLHVSDDYYNKFGLDRIEEMMRLTQTTSPSYLIMSSLDIARSLMEHEGQEKLNRLIKKCKNIKEMLKYNKLKVIDDEVIGTAGVSYIDPSRLTVNFRNQGIIGYEADKKLRELYNIQVEMSDFYNIVCICTVSDTDNDIDFLGKMIVDFSKSSLRSDYHRGFAGNINYFELPKAALTPREAQFAKGKYINLENAKGCISKNSICPYPPGISVVCPGEIISEEAINYLTNIINGGGNVNGIKNGKVFVIA